MQNPVLQLLSGKKQNTIESMYNNMMQNNPKFRQFVKDNEGKTIQEIAEDYDIDLSILNHIK